MIDLTAVIKNIDGKPVSNSVQGKISDWTFRDAFITALTGLREQNESGEIKFKKYQLAVKIQNTEKTVDLSIDDSKLLKELCGEIYGPVAVGQIWLILDPEGCSGSPK